MSYFIRIVCRSSAPITCVNLMEYISDSALLDSEPRFEPALESLAAQKIACDWFELYYTATTRPIRFDISVGDDIVADERQELIGIVRNLDAGMDRDATLAHLAGAYQIVAIEIDPGHLIEDAWELLDSVESFVARTYDGIIYMPEEGFYDAQLCLVLPVRCGVAAPP
jgi:hypothetical protein